MNRSRILPFAALLALAACEPGDVNNSLGLGKEAPDEFVVVSRPPLVVPPEFDLAPPRPGEESPHVESTQAQARKLLLGTTAGAASLDDIAEPTVDTAVTPVLAGDAPTTAGSNFLKQIGADSADPNVRQELSKDVKLPVQEKEADSLYEEMVGSKKEEPVVNPAGESERLRANKDAGKPVTEGDTPTEDTTPKSVIDGVF